MQHFEVGAFVYIGAVGESRHYGTSVAQIREVQIHSKMDDNGNKTESRSYVAVTSEGKKINLNDTSGYTLFPSVDALNAAIRAHYSKIVSEKIALVARAAQKFVGAGASPTPDLSGPIFDEPPPAEVVQRPGAPVPTAISSDPGYITVQMPDGTTARMKKPEGV